MDEHDFIEKQYNKLKEKENSRLKAILEEAIDLLSMSGANNLLISNEEYWSRVEEISTKTNELKGE